MLAANRLIRSVLLRHMLFVASALLAVLAVGYRFGSFDQVFHIPFLKKMVDPSLYPGDPFLDFRFYQYSYFWYFFEPFLRAGILEPVMFAVHLIATYLTFWMLWELSITLFDNPLAALITTLAFIFPHLTSPGFPLIEDSLLNRTFVLPFLLMAMVLYLRRRTLLAFLLLGLMFNLHAPSVLFVGAMLACDSLVRWRELGWPRILAGFLLFGVSALPVLVWKTSQTGFDLQMRPEVLGVVARGALASMYFMISTQPILIFLTLCGVGTLAIFWIGLGETRSPHDRSVIHFIFAIGLLLMVQIVTTYFLPVTIFLQLQLLRVAFYLLIFGYLYFAHKLVRCLQDGRLTRLDAAIQMGTFLIVTVPFVTWFVWAMRVWISGRRWRQITACALIGGGTLAVALLGRVFNIWQPGYHLYAPQTPWVAVQDWARENTPLDAMFITPPQIYSQYIPDWRVFSERGTVATLDSLEEILYDPASLPEWESRFEAVAPGAIARFDYNYVTSEQYTAAAYYSLTADEIVHIAREYRASYLVLEKPHVQSFPVVYENADFTVYDLRLAAGP